MTIYLGPGHYTRGPVHCDRTLALSSAVQAVTGPVSVLSPTWPYELARSWGESDQAASMTVAAAMARAAVRHDCDLSDESLWEYPGLSVPQFAFILDSALNDDRVLFEAFPSVSPSVCDADLVHEIEYLGGVPLEGKGAPTTKLRGLEWFLSVTIHPDLEGYIAVHSPDKTLETAIARAFIEGSVKTYQYTPVTQTLAPVLEVSI